MQLGSNEIVVDHIDQDLAARGFAWWRKFSVTLTDKRIHWWDKKMGSRAQKTFDLRAIQSVHYQRSINWGNVIGGGSLVFLGIMFVFSSIPLFLVSSEVGVGIGSMFLVLGLLILGLAVVLLFLFPTKWLLVIGLSGDIQSIEVLKLQDGRLERFSRNVLEQKDRIMGVREPAPVEVVQQVSDRTLISRLRCPRCYNVVETLAGREPVCPNCGFTTPR